MAEHTPTDDEREADAAFSRWLAAHDAEKDLEIARQADIIALLREDEAELHRLRTAGVVAEEPEGVVEYRVLDADGEFWAGADRLAEALHYLALEPGGRIERAVWVPVEQEGAEDR